MIIKLSDIEFMFISEMFQPFWILDTGYWILDTGYWILDTGYWILDTGYWIYKIYKFFG